MSRFTVSAAAVALVGFVGAAHAQSAPTFESLDKNSDGQVSLTEASADDALFVAFKGLDSNKDGALTREEFARYKK